MTECAAIAFILETNEFVLVITQVPTCAHPLVSCLSTLPVDQLVRDVVQELARQHLIDLPPLRADGRPGQVETPLGTSHAHIGQPTLFLHLIGIFQTAGVREGSLLHTGQEDHRILQALGRV